MEVLRKLGIGCDVTCSVNFQKSSKQLFETCRERRNCLKNYHGNFPAYWSGIECVPLSRAVLCPYRAGVVDAGPGEIADEQATNDQRQRYENHCRF